MAWPNDLIRYQTIDQALQEINRQLTAIETALADESAVQATQQRLEQCQAAAKTTRQAQKALEFELQTLETKFQATQHKLYSGKITNPRELQDLQAESKALQRRRAALEDELLEAMVARETAEEDLATAQAHADETQATRAAHIEALHIERAELRTQGSALLQEGQQLKAEIPAVILESYNYLKSRTGGIPVAQLKGEVCSMCGVEVIKPALRKALGGEEAYCDGCRRLLVA